MRFAGALALSLAAVACGGGNSDNVMAPQANALSPEQVDLALGPELASTGSNAVASAGEVDAVDSVEPDVTPASNVAVSAPRTTNATAEPANDAADEPSTEPAPSDDNSAEE